MTTFGEVHDVTAEFYFEWQIDDFFSLPEKDGGRCRSPSFSFAGESWYFTVFPNGASTTNSVGYIGAYLHRKSCGPPITLAGSLGLKFFEGKKYKEMHFTEDVETGWGRRWGCPHFLKRSVLSEKKSALAPSDVLTLVCHIEYCSESSVGAGDTEAAKCSHCKNTFGAEYLSSHEQKCLDKPIRCPTCGNVVALRNWIDHECDTARIKEKEKEKTSPEVNDIKDDVSDVPGSNESEVSCYNETSTIEWEEKLGNADLEKNHEDIPAGPSSQIEEEIGIGSLNQDFKEVFLNGNISDVVLRVKDQESSDHKCILATRTPTFMTVILHDTKEEVTPVVNLQDVDRNIFPDFINYLFTGRVENLTSESSLKLYTIAYKYQITKLKKTCLQHMLTNISIDSFCDVYIFSLRHHEVDLEKTCIQFFAQNSFDIILTAKWQSFLCENPVIGNELFIKHMQLNK